MTLKRQIEPRPERVVNAVKKERRKILVIGKEDCFSGAIMDYSISVGERLGHELLLMNIGPARDGKHRVDFHTRAGEAFAKRAADAAENFKREAARHGLHCEHVVRFGDLGSITQDICHHTKRIEFAITESNRDKEEIAGSVMMPVYCVNYTNSKKRGGKFTMNKKMSQQAKPVGLTIGCGLVSAALYAAVFLNANIVMKYFTKGGLFAVLPIVTVFSFSFAHGAFASNLWSLLGIKARKTADAQPTVSKTVQDKKRARKRPRVYAYTNPFHNIKMK